MSTTISSLWKELAQDPQAFKEQAKIEIEKALKGEYGDLKVRKFFDTNDIPLVDALIQAAYKQEIEQKGSIQGCIYQIVGDYQTASGLEELTARLNLALGHIFEFTPCDQRDYAHCFTIATV